MPWVTPSFLALTRPGRFLILCYHRVSDDQHPFFPGTPVSLFRRQMEVLRRRFTVGPLVELAERARRGNVPNNAVAITFDDGYRDNFTSAFPILKELGLPATIFLVTQALDENGLIWHDRVFDAFHRTSNDELRFENETLPQGSHAERERALASVLTYVRGSTPEERERAIEVLLRALGVESRCGGPWEKLRWDEVREMARSGIDFGAHTLDHPILKHVGLEEARRQIRGSKERIEAELRAPIGTFAYPNGRACDFDESTARILAEEGFACAVTTVAGANDAGTDPYRLHRVGMWGEDPHVSALRLAWARRAG